MSNDPRHLLPALRGRRVLVVGDVMLDEWLDVSAREGDTERGAPIARVVTRAMSLGGAGHVAATVAALGGRAILVGAVGQDPAGSEVRRLLGVAEPPIEDRLIEVPGRETTTKTRIRDAGRQIIRFDAEVAAPLPSDAGKDLLVAALGGLAGAD